MMARIMIIVCHPTLARKIQTNHPRLIDRHYRPTSDPRAHRPPINGGGPLWREIFGCTLILIPLFFSGSVLAAESRNNGGDYVRPIPPAGIRVPSQDTVELRRGLEELGQALNMARAELTQKRQTKLLELLPDAEIFHKAVDYALAYDEFFSTNEIAAAKVLLRQGLERAQRLRAGQAPWTNTTGLVVRGFRSRLDDSVQPYGLLVPESARNGMPLRLDVWLHGRGETMSEVNFLNAAARSAGPFAPPHTLVLQPYNRYCNAARFAGETDVFEALAHAKRFYPIDDNRVLVRGFSMGGASCWGLATHHASLWAAAAPGAGFSETAEYLKVFQHPASQPSWWEKKLWRLYDARDYALNLYNVPVVAYSGEIDSQRQAAEVMAKALAQEGLRLTHIIGPRTGHAYEPQAKTEVARRIDALAARGRQPVPARVKFVTYTLRYNRMFWITVDALGQHWERARVEAVIEPVSGKIEVTTQNVTGLSLAFGPGEYPLEPNQPTKLAIDGDLITAPPPFTDLSFTAHLRKDGGHWQEADAMDNASLRKRHGLQGPIDDAFMERFLMVIPTGQSIHEAVANWCQKERLHAVEHWRKQFRGDARLKPDREVSDRDIAESNLILWGDPSSNEVLKRIADRLPIHWDARVLRVGGQNYVAGHHVPVMIFPNPLNPSRYVVLNSGFTFRESDYLSNARQTPKLPDWAIIDIGQPATSHAPGGIIDAGFFGEHWQWQPVTQR